MIIFKFGFQVNPKVGWPSNGNNDHGECTSPWGLKHPHQVLWSPKTSASSKYERAYSTGHPMRCRTEQPFYTTKMSCLKYHCRRSIIQIPVAVGIGRRSRRRSSRVECHSIGAKRFKDFEVSIGESKQATLILKMRCT